MHRISLRLFACAIALLFSGAFASAQDKEKADDAHPTKGPHKGALIELGDEEYHAELVHDEKENKVTIYVLDSKAKTAVPIEAKEIAINVKLSGKPKQFKLNADPEKSDGENMSSRFSLTDKSLCELLDNEKAECRLRIEIKGKSFNGKIKHEHGHEHGHDHGHEHKEKKS